ncbi:MAG: hypothetical protein FWC34_09205 [Bacteroidetes bacterium]|nr:hypothetical protein [Bacteroidota bacterium]MCL2303024.1 hypothetical protein [Lentimicrobiaceae bacterium]
MKKIICINCWLIAIFFTALPATFAQSNRLTTEKGELLWQYNQNVTIDKENPNNIVVTFVFINGINQTAISLRQELFTSKIEWLNTADVPVEKEERVDFLTVNLAPLQSIVWKYVLKPKPIDNELFSERSALLIMNEGFEIRKEVIPEQKVGKAKK